MNILSDVESISSRDDFVLFVIELSRDFHANGLRWENNDLGSYLAALAAWVKDMEGFYSSRGQSTPQQPQWKDLANMMMAARVYE